MRYLIDTSALVRLQRDQGGAAWKPLVARGLVAVCEPVLAETLLIADAKQYAAVERAIYGSYLKVTVPDGIWDTTEVLRHELVSRFVPALRQQRLSTPPP